MKRFYFVVFFLILISVNAYAEQEKPRIAILPLKVEGKNTIGDISDTLNTLVANSFTESQYFQLIERNQIQTILAENKYQRSGLVDEKTAVQLGKHLGVKYVLIGSYLAEKQSNYNGVSVTLSLRMVDVENATVYKSFLESAEGQTIGIVLGKLTDGLNAKVAKLLPASIPVSTLKAKQTKKVLVILQKDNITCAKEGSTKAETVELSFFNENINDYYFIVTEISKILGKDVSVFYENIAGDANIRDLPKHSTENVNLIILIKLTRTGKLHTFSRISEHRAQISMEFIEPKDLNSIGFKTVDTEVLKGKMYEIFPLIKQAIKAGLHREINPFPYEI